MPCVVTVSSSRRRGKTDSYIKLLPINYNGRMRTFNLPSNSLNASINSNSVSQGRKKIFDVSPRNRPSVMSYFPSDTRQQQMAKSSLDMQVR